MRTSQSESVPASSIVTRLPAAACWYTESQVLSCMNRELCRFEGERGEQLITSAALGNP